MKAGFVYHRDEDRRAARQLLCERCVAKERRKEPRWEPRVDGWACDRCGTTIRDYGVNEVPADNEASAASSPDGPSE